MSMVQTATPVRLGVIGAGRGASGLGRYAGLVHRIRLVAWAAGPEEPGARDAAMAARVPFRQDWEDVADDPGLDALLLLSGTAQTIEVAARALRSGKVVHLSTPPPLDEAAWDRLSQEANGTLLVSGALARTEAGMRAQRVVASGGIGRLHSIYVAVRQTRLSDAAVCPGVVQQLGWDVVEFVLACAAAEVVRVHAEGGALFGPGPAEDTAVVIIRFANDATATLELSRCLPPGLPIPAAGEVEFEIIGATETLRGAPYNTAIRLQAATAQVCEPWEDDPILCALDDIVGAFDGLVPPGRDLARAKRVAGVRAAIERALARSRNGAG